MDKLFFTWNHRSFLGILFLAEDVQAFVDFIMIFDKHDLYRDFLGSIQQLVDFVDKKVKILNNINMK